MKKMISVMIINGVNGVEISSTLFDKFVTVILLLHWSHTSIVVLSFLISWVPAFHSDLPRSGSGSLGTTTSFTVHTLVHVPASLAVADSLECPSGRRSTWWCSHLLVRYYSAGDFVCLTFSSPFHHLCHDHVSLIPSHFVDGYILPVFPLPLDGPSDTFPDIGSFLIVPVDVGKAVIHLVLIFHISFIHS